MILILARHGRTFMPNQPAVYIGAQQDPPLSPQGTEQAHSFGQSLVGIAPRLRRVYTSPMLRTRQFAELVCRALGSGASILPAEVLQELHYGKWAGRSQADILQMGEHQALKDWDTSAVYPQGAGFSPAREEVIAGLQGWLAGLFQANSAQNDVVLAVTHGGILRLLRRCLHIDPASIGPACAVSKMACGNAAVVEVTLGRAALRAWNLDPSATDMKALCLPHAPHTLAGP